MDERKAGRPRFLDDEKQKQVCEIISLGATQQDAADYLGCDVSTITKERRRNPEFAEALAKAHIACKIHHLRVLSQAGDSKTSQYVLERKFWQDWGKKNPDLYTPEEFASFALAVADKCKNYIPSDFHSSFVEDIKLIIDQHRKKR